MHKTLIFALQFAMLITLAIHATGVKASDTSTDKVDAYIRSEMDELKIPGLEAVVVHEDQIVYAKGFGIADPSGHAIAAHTPMILGSVSKGFTALAVMQLVEAGNIELDAPVQKYLSWFQLTDNPDMDPPDAWKQITIRQLLNHTSGIPEYAGANSFGSSYLGADALEKQIASFADFALVHTPGTTFEYSNANYQTLGMIVQQVSGEPFEHYIKTHIFEPLEMQNSHALVSEASDLATGYRFFFGKPVASPNIPTPRSDTPSAFIMSNAEDMGHYLIAQMNGGKYEAVQILSAQGIDQLHHSRVDSGFGFEYAMGWAIDPDGTLSHTGETPTFSSGIRIEDDWGVFVVRNIAANQREQRLDEIAPGILNIMRGEEPVRYTEDPSFRRIMTALVFLFFIQMAFIIASLVRLRRPNPSARNERSVIGAVIALPFSLSLAAGLWYAGPISNHRAFNVLFQSAPDQLLLLVLNIGLALLSAAVQVFRLHGKRKA